MISAAQAVSAMQAAEQHSPRPQQLRTEGLATPPGQQQQQQVEDELRSAAVKMRLELPLKERIIHLQTFKYTFTGQQAVTFLQQRGLASNQEVAADMCQRMLSQSLFKSIYHREVFSADGEVYRFSSSFPDGNKQKARIPGSITSTGLYKEIAKIGKTAAQPFKNIQLSLNDTFNSLGSLTIPTAAKPGQLGSSLGGGRPRTSSSNGTARTFPRRSQPGKLHHVYSDSMHGLQDGSGSLADLVSSIDALQASIKESTSLLRLDLQQHTALQEHIVGALMAQQDSARNMQLLVGLNAFALLLLLGSSGGWTATIAAGCILAALLYVLGLGAVGWIRQPAAAPEAVSLRRSSVTLARGAEQPLRKASRSLGSATAAGVEVPGALGDSVHNRSDGEHDSDEAEDLEDAIPYSEDFDDWPDAPVMLCPDPAAAHQEFEVEGPGPCHALALNGDPIPFETELFKGVVAVYIRHLPTTPTHLFKGKKRLAWVALQGTFKLPVLMEHLVYGMEFSRQLSNLPAPWFLENMLLPLARKISPSLRVGTLEDPFFFSPIITASQIVNVSLPGQAPPLMDAKEDTRLLLDELGGKAGDGLTVASRRRYFQAAGNRHIPFSTAYVWTFHLWQEYIDYASYMLNLGYSSYDLVQHLDGQPLQLTAKDESTGQQLIALHVWHTNLVRCLARRLPRKARPSRISNVSLDEAGPHHRSVQVTGNGGATDTDTCVASPTSTLQQTSERLLTPSHLQMQQQEQQGQFDSAPLPVLDLTTPHQQQQQQQDQFEDALESQEVPQQEPTLQLPPQHQQQQTLELRLQQQQQQLPHSYSSSSRQSDSSASRKQQQHEEGPTHSSHSDSRLQRPKGLRGYRDSEGSMSDPDNGPGSAAGAGAGLPQLSPLRPASQSAGTVVLQQGGRLQPQLSLPAQRQLQGDSQLFPPGEPQPSSVSGLAAAAAGGSSPRGVPGALGAAAGGGSPMDSWSAAARTLSNARAGRLCSTPSGVSVLSTGEGGARASADGASSPLACRTPRNPGGSSGSGPSSGGVAAAAAAAMLRAQPHLGQQQQSSAASAKKQKQKEQQRDKEERQRQQLHGLSVMGAL